MLAASAGCSGGSDQDTVRTSEQAGASTSPAANSVDLTAEGLEALARGLTKEVEAVRAAQQKSASATTPEERGEAIQASFESATIPQGAEAAGLPVDQYRALRETVVGIFRTLDFQGKIDGPLSIDLSRADAATKERISRDPFADLSPGSAAALRSQMDRLVPIWVEYVSLTAVAG
jgi:hypothetical protein